MVRLGYREFREMEIPQFDHVESPVLESTTDRSSAAGGRKENHATTVVWKQTNLIS